MDYTTNDSQKHRKKEIAVAIVLLLLGLATMTGIAYAYSSDYTLNNNPIYTDSFMIMQTDDEMNEVNAVLTSDIADIDVYTKIVDGVVSMYSGGSEFTREFYVTVVTDKDCQFTIHTEFAGDEFTDKLFTINDVDDIVADGNVATKITVTFTPLIDVDLSEVVETDTTDRDNLADVQSEIESHKLSFTVTATPVE